MLKSKKFLLIVIMFITLTFFLNGCSQKSETCVDSDGGQTYDVKGVVTLNGETFEDECKDSNNLAENYCLNNELQKIKYSCDCVDGRCTEEAPPGEPPETCVSETEICNGKDDDCDKIVDEGCVVFEPQDGVLAFPGAEGWGAKSQGGKGGVVLAVTNLNDAGPGSFRDAVTRSGPRIVRFDVAGTIVLKSKVRVNNPYLTIAGQTAPGDGIQVIGENENGFLELASHDIIVRNYRGRTGIFYEGISTKQGVYSLSVIETYNIIIDHSSFQFSDDSVVQFWKHCTDITIQNSIISHAPWEAINVAGTNAHTPTGALPAERISLIGNIFAHAQRRNPNINEAVQSEVVNNVIVNPRANGGYAGGGSQVDYIGNIVMPGVNTGSGSIFTIDQPTSNMKIYRNDNIVQGSNEFMTGDEPYKSNFRVGDSGYVPKDTNVLVAYLTENAGALPHDAIDQQVINDMLQGTGRLIFHQRDIGGYPNLTGTPRTQDDWDKLVEEKGGVEEALNSFYE